MSYTLLRLWGFGFLLPRFIFMTYPWYWIKRMYRSKHFRQFLVVCMACTLAVSVFLTNSRTHTEHSLVGTRRAGIVVVRVQAYR